MGSGVENSFGRRTGRSRRADRLRGLDASAGSFAPQAGERLAGLDLARLLAALAVVVFHFGYAGPLRGSVATAYPEIAGIAKYGFIGVDLFFLISGYVISASAAGRTWRAFAVARTLRLYPAFVVCMTLTAVGALVLGARGQDVTVLQWLANLTMVAPAFGQSFMDGAYWSIVVEIVFYGWVGVLIALGIFERRFLTILAVWLAIAAVNEAFLHSRVLRLVLCTEYAGLFAAGMLVQRLRAGEKSLVAWVLLGLAVSLGALGAFGMERLFVRLYGDTISRETLWGLHLVIHAVFLGALWLSRWIAATPSVLATGALTYPLYLLHQHLGYGVIDGLLPFAGRWGALVLTIAAVLALAYVVQRWAEPLGRELMRRALAAVPGQWLASGAGIGRQRAAVMGRVRSAGLRPA
jgi:peptidoglycan/LPS O-acetylase OafA/YrhL